MPYLSFNLVVRLSVLTLCVYIPFSACGLVANIYRAYVASHSAKVCDFTCIIMVIIMGITGKATHFHADSNELLCVSIALKLIEILLDCDRT